MPVVQAFIAQRLKQRIATPVLRPLQVVGYPGAIHLSPADEGPAAKGPVEVVSAVDQVRCVVNQLGGVSGLVQGPRESLDIVPKWFPRVERPTVSACHHIGSIGNGRETGTKGTIESPGFCGQAIDVRGSDPVVSISSEMIVAQRIDHDKDDVHRRNSSSFLSCNFKPIFIIITQSVTLANKKETELIKPIKR